MTTIKTQTFKANKTALSTKKKVKPTHFHLRIFSRHPSIAPLRTSIMIKGRKAVYRHGSTTEADYEYEINGTDAIKTSSDKLKMKRAFDAGEVRHCKWIHMSIYQSNKAEFDKFISDAKLSDKEKRFLIIKHRMGSRGTGNFLIKNKTDLDNFINTHKGSLDNYIIEQYKNFTVEYRLHVSELGCFYTCRKVLKANTPPEKRFQRHDDNCSWLLEGNPGFGKPSNWDAIVQDCIKALKAMNADVLAFDVKCTSTKEDRSKPCDWILIESCSAPSFGSVTVDKYKEHLPKIITHKYGSN